MLQFDSDNLNASLFIGDLMIYIIIGILAGLMPAMMARDKGRDFFTWWIYSAFLFPVAIIHLFFIPKK